MNRMGLSSRLSSYLANTYSKTHNISFPNFCSTFILVCFNSFSLYSNVLPCKSRLSGVVITNSLLFKLKFTRNIRQKPTNPQNFYCADKNAKSPFHSDLNMLGLWDRRPAFLESLM